MSFHSSCVCRLDSCRSCVTLQYETNLAIRVSFSFLPKGERGGGGGGLEGQKEIVWIIWGGGGGGGHVHICMQRMRQTRGIWGHAPPGSFDFGLLLDANWWNLGLFSH